MQAPKAFSQLVMLCPSPCYLNDPPHYQGGFAAEQLDGLLQELADGHHAWSHAMAPVIMANPERPALTADLAARFCAMGPAIALRWARATFLTDLRPVVPQVTVPTLVLHCREDAIAGPAVGEWVARAQRKAINGSIAQKRAARSAASAGWSGLEIGRASCRERV